MCSSTTPTASTRSTQAYVPLVDEHVAIQYIEVHTPLRGGARSPLGSRRASRRHTQRRLFAYSEDADAFWQPLDTASSCVR